MEDGRVRLRHHPAVFTSVEELEKDFVYNDFCGNNLSKYLIKESRKEGKILAFLKPCDTYSFNQLLKEHRILRDNVYVVGVPCEGKTDGETLKAKGVKGILGIRTEGDSFAVDTLYGEKTLAKADALPSAVFPARAKSTWSMTSCWDRRARSSTPTASTWSKRSRR